MEGIKFKVNNRVEVIFNEENFICNLQDIKEEGIAISIPIREGEYLPLKNGEVIQAYYYDKKSIYKFSSVVIGRERKNISLIWIAIPTKYKKIQRRKFVRVNLLLKVRYAVVRPDIKLDINSIASLEFLDAVALDLSGGGIRLNIKEKLKHNNHVVVELPMENKEMFIIGKVVRVDKDELGNNTYGIKFLNMNFNKQDKIIEYVFKIMREQMKKGLKEE